MKEEQQLQTLSKSLKLCHHDYHKIQIPHGFKTDQKNFFINILLLILSYVFHSLK
ncbi:hypothetical protein BSM4216_1020 [Bacillus smithii]|nr:hypothetical protein BSM4216_1020 [Bacillus smithii]